MRQKCTVKKLNIKSLLFSILGVLLDITDNILNNKFYLFIILIA
jgi:hypothetical protein